MNNDYPRVNTIIWAFEMTRGHLDSNPRRALRENLSGVKAWAKHRRFLSQTSYERCIALWTVALCHVGRLLEIVEEEEAWSNLVNLDVEP